MPRLSASTTALPVVLLLILVPSIYCCAQVSGKFGKGLTVAEPDSSFKLHIGFRWQTLLSYQAPASGNEIDFSAAETAFLIRRARLKLDGFAFSEKFKYKIQIGLSNRDIAGANKYTHNAPLLLYDAVAMWNFCKSAKLLIGQTKLPGNREFLVSSGDLQFVDRSLLHSRFGLDRDMGLQLHHKFLIKKILIRDIFSVSQGEGRDITTGNYGGFDYTGRLEVLPLGEFFEKKGEYTESDLSREPDPKLAVAVSYDYNRHAPRQDGQGGSFIMDNLPALPEDDFRSLSTVFADLMFKYKGISVMAEFANKTTDKSPKIIDTALQRTFIYSAGSAINMQVGYLFRNNWEVASRYTSINPETATGMPQLKQYTLGISKYIFEHKLKVQSDFSYTAQKTTAGFEANGFLARFQMEVHL